MWLKSIEFIVKTARAQDSPAVKFTKTTSKTDSQAPQQKSRKQLRKLARQPRSKIYENDRENWLAGPAVKFMKTTEKIGSQAPQ
jgi:hypothetical protein